VLGRESWHAIKEHHSLLSRLSFWGLVLLEVVLQMHQLCTCNGIVTFSIHNRGEFPLIGRVELYGGRRFKIPAELSSAGYSRVAA